VALHVQEAHVDQAARGAGRSDVMLKLAEVPLLHVRRGGGGKNAGQGCLLDLRLLPADAPLLQHERNGGGDEHRDRRDDRHTGDPGLERRSVALSHPRAQYS